jgi:CBS domain-containing protein
MPETVASILRDKGSDVWSTRPDASVYDAIALMAGKSVGALIVLDDGLLVGILSERDYARKVILQGRSSKDTQVAEIMASPVFTVRPSSTVYECMELVTAKRIRHLPVVDDNKVVGIVSIGDLVRKIVAAQRETIQHLHEYIAGPTVVNPASNRFD